MVDTLTLLVFYSLVAFRLAELLVFDDGPFDLFSNLRGWLNGAPFNNGLRRNLSNILTCVHCAGLWISLFLGIIYHFTSSQSVVDSVLFALAMAGLQSLISNNLGRSAE